MTVRPERQPVALSRCHVVTYAARMSPTAWLVIYCVLILLASLVGGWIPLIVRLTHKRMELAVSFVAGVMLGVGLLHMLPNAIASRAHTAHLAEHSAADEPIGPVMLWLLAGFLVMFFIERFFCFHHHEPPEGNPAQPLQSGCVDDHHEEHSVQLHAHHPPHSRHHLTWTGAAIGLSIHSLIEGIALAASVEAGRMSLETHGETASSAYRAAAAGLGTFLVIFLHKPFDSLTLGTLLSLGHWPTRARHAVNFAFSMLVPFGILLFYLGLNNWQDGQAVVSSALAFSAGTFLCIAMSDLLPELQFHQHDRIKLSGALLAGLALAWGLGVLEHAFEG